MSTDLTDHGAEDRPVAPGPNRGEETATLIYRLVSVTDRLDWRVLFPAEHPVELELGSGDGSFLVRYAALHPEVNFLGVERLLGRLNKIDRKARRAGLTNVRGLRLEAAYLLEYMIPPASLAAVHVYFPDPWPKRRHRANRLINARFTEITSRALMTQGCIYLRTDDADYFAQMQEVFAANPAFRLVETPESLASVRTDFEEEFNGRGIPTLRAAYQRGGAEDLVL